jgi:tetratricopeptide (TPR) repeat protein
MEARKRLSDGVQAFKDGQIDQAIADFQNAKDLDPSLLNAQLYLATAYSARYIPSDPAAENVQRGDQTLQECRSILGAHPDNPSAIDGVGASTGPKRSAAIAKRARISTRSKQSPFRTRIRRLLHSPRSLGRNMARSLTKELQI